MDLDQNIEISTDVSTLCNTRLNSLCLMHKERLMHFWTGEKLSFFLKKYSKVLVHLSIRYNSKVKLLWSGIWMPKMHSTNVCGKKGFSWWNLVKTKFGQLRSQKLVFFIFQGCGNKTSANINQVGTKSVFVQR